jgi:CheY-like chemotaxis protein
MRRKILLADDSPTIQRLVTQTFADGNFEIISVSNGDAAIRKFDEILPSVVLADIYMPGKNGFEVCAYVKNHPSHGSTPVILLVGAFDAYDEENGKQVGAVASITKPFEPHALVELVQSVIDHPHGHMDAVTDEHAARSVEPRSSRYAVNAEPVVTGESSAPAGSSADDSLDLLGLEDLFRPEKAADPSKITEEDIDRIADRVIERISSQIIESIAWEVVPDITEKVVREELKRIHEG